MNEDHAKRRGAGQPPRSARGPGHHSIREDSPDGSLSVAPSLGVTLERARMPQRAGGADSRIFAISGYALVIGVAAAYVAQALVALIGLVTNLAFYGRWSTAFVSPAGNHLGAWVVLVPVLGGLIVGVMARWGSPAIRGHGIPEAMEQILRNDSKIPPRMTFLKPLSSAIAIGTGGPFGAEGPIIATGGAFGSFLGQVLHVTANERKVLLAAGAAAGMAAIFASPVSATLLAVELLLFELRPQSLIPVALATVAATGIRYATVGFGAVFPMPPIAAPGGPALAVYVVLGAFIGLCSVGVTRIGYGVEGAFEKIPVPWMWWPAIGGIAVGAIGYFAPLTFGVGYTNIQDIVAGRLAFDALAALMVMKFLSWSIALGSGTSGGTLAPLFTIGGALGAILGQLLSAHAPGLGVDPRIAALVGMAAIFAGASRALLTSIVFAFETTRQFAGMLPLLGGCTAAYFVSVLLMRTTIMTEKIVRRGTRVPDEYSADFLAQVRVGDVCARTVRTVRDTATVGEIRAWFPGSDPDNQHQGYPVIDAEGHLRGVITRRQVQNARHADSVTIADLVTQEPLVAQEGHSLREAADHMVAHSVGRLVVVADSPPHDIVGIITRGDLLAAHAKRLREARPAETHLRLRRR